MDQTHIHLFITHLPLFGSALALIVLLMGMQWKNPQTIKAAYLLLVITALGAVTAYLTGEAAEETAELIQGVSENAIEEHEDAGKLAFFTFIPLGLLALVGLLFPAKKWARKVPAVTVILTLIGFVCAFRAAGLGGKIRHTEIDNPPVSEVQQPLPEKVSHMPVLGVKLDGGKKWNANSETTAAISNMLKLINAFPEDPSHDQVEELKKSLQFEFKELVRQCTMTGEAHDQLHNYILPLRDKIDQLGDEEPREIIPELKAHLEAYDAYFK